MGVRAEEGEESEEMLLQHSQDHHLQWREEKEIIKG